MGVEQSNTSLVFDDQLVLKLYRRLEPGVNPELELLRFLTEHGFPNIPTLEGWAQYLGKPMDATLAILQHFVASDGDGWKLALDSLAGDPEPFLGAGPPPRRGHGRAAHSARLGLLGSRVLRGGAELRGACAAGCHRGRGDRERVRLPARRPGPRSDRGARGGRARAAARCARTWAPPGA